MDCGAHGAVRARGVAPKLEASDGSDCARTGAASTVGPFSSYPVKLWLRRMFEPLPLPSPMGGGGSGPASVLRLAVADAGPAGCVVKAKAGTDSISIGMGIWITGSLVPADVPGWTDPNCITCLSKGQGRDVHEWQNWKLITATIAKSYVSFTTRPQRAVAIPTNSDRQHPLWQL
jgi:hypothetical protein